MKKKLVKEIFILKNAATAMYPSLKKNCSSFVVPTRSLPKKTSGFRKKMNF